MLNIGVSQNRLFSKNGSNGKMSPQNDFQNYRPITEIERSLFVFNGIPMGNGPILNIMSENDLNMIDLVLTSSQPTLGSPLNLDDPWRHA